MPISAHSHLWQRISTLLLLILTSIAGLVLLGLVVMMLRLVSIQSDLASLRDSALPRLVKLSRLSQEASAAIAIAPALSAKPTRFEFETLLSRIKDKESSRIALIEEIGVLIGDENGAVVLRNNGDLLSDNLQKLIDEVRQQIAIRKQLATHIEELQKLLRPVTRAADENKQNTTGQDGSTDWLGQLANTVVYKIISTLLDPNSARFSRNKREIENSAEQLANYLDMPGDRQTGVGDEATAASKRLAKYWSTEKETIYRNKRAELSNEFKIKALTDENSSITNRLLTSANNEFRRANAELQSQIQTVEKTTWFTLVVIVVVVLAFGAGNTLVWIVLKRRVFIRLNQIRNALQEYAKNRDKVLVDPIPDEIGKISESLIHYMTVIDEHEAELAEKTHAMEALSIQLAKYLSPQVYASIFSGKQAVEIASKRKKLTVFFSDIADFTGTTDSLESEELTNLLNHYLTEMSKIALDYGATIDKYVGDAIIAFFGDPETRGVKEDARTCVNMAIAMQRRMQELQSEWLDMGLERPFQLRIGINTGFCTVGNFGSRDRMDYTIIGNEVNLAARLESLAEVGGILLAHETYSLVKDAVLAEERDTLTVKGFTNPVRTYSVVGLYDALVERGKIIRKEQDGIQILVELKKGNRADAIKAIKDVLSELEDKVDTEPSIG